MWDFQIGVIDFRFFEKYFYFYKLNLLNCLMKKNTKSPLKSLIKHKKELKRKIIRFRKKINPNCVIHDIYNKRGPTLKAPKVFNYLKNPLKCNYFYNSLRSKHNRSVFNGKLYIILSLKDIIDVDFAAISILKSIMEEARYHGIIFKGDSPEDLNCKKKLMDYGFFNNLYDAEKKHINIKSKGEHYSYEKKTGKLTVKDLSRFDEISEKSYLHIAKKEGFLDEISTILKEIGGNATEWSNSQNQQWLLSVYKSKNKVTINITDLGSGILETLMSTTKLKLIDFFLFTTVKDRLANAFRRKYGSVSQEINRNRGLPFIKKVFDDRKIKNLIVSTNSVFYNFEENLQSIEMPNAETTFAGTFYQWEIDEECINNYE